MAKNVSNNQTLEEFRQSYNDLVDEVGGLGSLRTSQKGSLVDSINSIIDQYFFFQDFEFDGSDGSSSNRTFSGTDNFGETLQYSVNRLLVFKNGTLLRSGTDYSATNGTSITLATSAANSDIIRITSFTGSYEGVAGATQAATTQWTKTGAGSIYNHDTTGGVVINADATGIVTAPPSGVGVQIESDGADIFLNAGGSSNKVDVNANLSLRSGMKLQKAGGDIAIGDIQGLQAAVRGAITASGDISYDNSTGVISFSQADAPVTSVAGKTGAVTLAEGDVSFTGGSLQERVQDIVGAFISGTGSTTVTYTDGSDSLVISSTGKTQEEIEDIVGAMVSGNTETGITVTYDDNGSGVGSLDFVIGDDAIVSSMIADNTIVGGNIAANTIGSSEIAANAVGASELADDAVDTDAIANNAVTLGTKTSGPYVSDVNVDSGELTASESNAGGETNSVTLGLADSGVTAGTYGSASAIPALVIDAFGRVTSASTNAVDTYSGWSVEADSGSKSVTEGTTIDIAGGEGIDTAVSGSTVTITGEDASATNKGIASFNSTHFGISSGAISIDTEFIEDTVGAMFSSNTESGITVTYDDNDGTIDLSTDVTQTPAITSNGSTPSLNSGISAAEIRDVIGLGTAATINFDGAYSSLSGLPTIVNDTGTPAILSDGSSPSLNSGISATEIRNLIGAGTSNFNGAYSSLSGLPTIPSNNNQLTNGAGYITGITSSMVTTALGYTPYNSSNPSNYLTSGAGTNVSFGVVTGTELRSTGDITAYYGTSDITLKENITPINNALDKVMSLDGINWTYKNDGRAMTGLIAQQVQKVLPEAVYKTNFWNSNGHLAIRYGNVVGLLVESIKELSEEIKTLKEKV